MSDHLVVFTPSGRRGHFASGTTVLDAARRLGVDIDSVCGGRGICGRCQVEVSEGEHAKHAITSAASHLSPIGAVERAYAADKGLAPRRRLGCTAHVEGELVIDVPPESQVHKQVVRKEADAHPIEINPVVRLYYVEVEEPDLASPTSDLGRLREALEREWELSELTVDDHVLPGLQKALRKGEWKVTVAVHDDTDLTAVWPGFHDTSYGIAFDIGSTTVAGHLCDLASGDVLASAGEMNPQIRFGEDLMSRVSYVMMNPGSEKELTRAVRGCLAKLTAELAKDAGISRDDILEFTLVGNPIMHHLLLGLDPTELGGAPFALTIDEAVRRPARDLGLPANPGARAYVLPCIAGHVGADAAAVILSEAPYLGEEVNLIVDIGTNAEIVLGNRDRLLAASSPTGPAFEGAQISCGQRAAPGAIERVRIDPKTLEPRFRVIGSEIWSDDPAFAGTLVTGVCGSGIIEVIAELHLAGVLTTDGTIDGTLAARSPRIVPGRPDVLLRPLRRRAAADRDPERHSPDPAREGGAARRLHAALRALRHRPRRPDQARRCVRESHRPRPRARARPRARLRSGQRHVGRQRRRHRCADRAARPHGPRRDRGGRPPRGEDRDGRRAALPGALRRCDGDPARHRPVCATARHHGTPAPPRRRCVRGAPTPAWPERIC